MADAMIVLLTAFIIAMAAPAMIDTRNILRLDVAAGLLMLGWLLPQMLDLRQDTFSQYFDPAFTYAYILVCMVLLAFGSWLGRRHAEHRLAADPAAYARISSHRYEPKRLGNAALAMTAIGGFFFFLMAQQAQNFQVNEQWSGVITLYFLLSQFVIFGGALGILVFMQHRERRGLFAFLVMIAIAIPVFAFFVRRSVLFQIAATTLGAVVLTRDIRVPRTVLAAGLAISVLILNGAGAIRQHIFFDGGTIVSAFTEGVVFKEAPRGVEVVAAELKSAISDIEITRQTGDYKPFVMLWNIAVSQYIPSFLVGEEFKASLLINEENRTVIESFFAMGATRTGFAESYSGYGWFGPFIYLAIGYMFGRLWILASRKDIRAQQTYLIFLLYSLLTITESISRVVVTAPILLATIWISFRYAARRDAAAHSPLGYT